MATQMMRMCAIHQPNFFPWLGYFDKIRRSDVFVFLDKVDYPKAGSGGMGSWVNRVKIDIQGKERWFGCPLEKYSGRKSIVDVVISEREDWRPRLLRTLEINYRKAPSYSRAMTLLKPLIENPTNKLAEYNIQAILAIANALGLECSFRRQSELSSQEHSTALLVEMTKKVGATAYLAGGGAAGYQDDALFAEHKLELVYQDYAPVTYGEADRFVAGLSIIDYLMHVEDWSLHFGSAQTCATS